MTRLDPRPWFVGFICVSILASPLVVLAVAGAISSSLSGLPEGGLVHLVGEYGSAWARSVGSGLFASIVTGVLALAAVYFLAVPALRAARRPDPFEILAHLAPLAIVPLLIGAASFAFIFRDLGRVVVALTGGDARGPFSIVAIEALAHTLRYAPLLVWLMILAIFQVPPSKRMYAQHAGFSGLSYIRAELANRWLVPLLVVLAFAFQDAANDHLIAQLAVRPSVATGTELMSHALERQFSILLSMRPAAEAINEIVLSGILAAAGFAVAFTILALVCVGGQVALRWRGFDGVVEEARVVKRTYPWAAMIVPVTTLAFVTLSAWSLRPGLWSSLEALIPSALLAMISAIVSWCIAAPLAYSLRDRLSNRDGSAPRTFFMLSGLAIAVGFIPPLSLAVAVFSFAFTTGFSGGAASVVWLFVAEVLRFTPVAFVLLVPTALAISDQDIDYLKSVGASRLARSSVVLFRPNAILHIAVVLICFNLILNEGVIASVFQAQVPSLTDIMRRAVTGRSANFPLAAALILSQGLIFAVMLWVWGRASINAWRLRHAAG